VRHGWRRSRLKLKVLLKIQEREGDYWWVECGGCEAGWQVPYYAESVGVRR
jgi:hypothetical protein